MKRILFLLLAAILSVVTLHSGRTDENGGHYDSTTGEYHYHHGYPAHQHENGVCPYEFDDRTEENSVTRSASVPEEKTQSKRSFFDIAEDVFLIFVGIYSVYRIVWFFFVEPRLEEAQRKARYFAPCPACVKRIRMSSKVCPFCGSKKPFSKL